MPKAHALTAYELERAERIAENARLLASLGLGLEPGAKAKAATPARPPKKRSRSESTTDSRAESAPPRKRQMIRPARQDWDSGNSDSEDELVSPPNVAIKRDDEVRLCRMCRQRLSHARSITPDLLEGDAIGYDRGLCGSCQESAHAGERAMADRAGSMTSTELDYKDAWRPPSKSVAPFRSWQKQHQSDRQSRESSMSVQKNELYVPAPENESELDSQESDEEEEEEEELEIEAISSCKIINRELHFHTSWKDRAPSFDTFQPLEDVDDTLALEAFLQGDPQLEFRGKRFALSAVLSWRESGCMMDRLTQATKGKASVKMRVKSQHKHG
ncbi:hypothetical protein BCR37DRAFT_392043 [Protomyces lactucae-debilis]|uniref:Uncharacterized protein n=1 Tax=Protomyces lactucae-debilis TaxID=2754530 RepID=A0A1Y2FKF7_PROLT|nr:uncharacterized protein BCR37DRAFT_392043 [Protomyces lactucae-debilis]ORY84471.1 hypothetical protein BCR37DRAFT_392043 [Protomyces lactucae-debilis]